MNDEDARLIAEYEANLAEAVKVAEAAIQSGGAYWDEERRTPEVAALVTLFIEYQARKTFDELELDA